MTIRSISKIGLVNIGRQVRGEALEGKVTLRLSDVGIVASPFTPGDDEQGGAAHITRFDQYNRISLPSELRRAANINKKVDVTLDGDNLIIAPVIDVCAICGTDQNLHKVGQDKYICEVCRKQMVWASRK